MCCGKAMATMRPQCSAGSVKLALIHTIRDEKVSFKQAASLEGISKSICKFSCTLKI